MNALWALYCCWPTKEEREARRLRKEEEEEEKALEKWNPEEWEAQEQENYEMNQFGKQGEFTTQTVPLSPTTPRTMAFRRLGGGSGGDLPLRNKA